jgi:hypothetical protein
MSSTVMQVIQTCQEDKPNGTYNGKDNRKNRQRFLKPGSIFCQSTEMSKPALSYEHYVEAHDGDGSHCDE